MPTEHPDIAEQLLKGQRRQTRAIIFVFLVLIAGGIYVWLQEARTHDALCTFRGELVVTNQQSRDFLRTHPHGIAGITAASIQVGIDNRQRTIDSLSSLNCPSTTP